VITKARTKHILRALCVAAGLVCISADDAPVHSVADAVAAESADALPITGFYDPPASAAKARPGQLLRKEAASYTLAVPVDAIRILYASTDGHGGKVATSAMVLTPKGTPPPGGWPLIAWAHGTSGMARMCGPSLMKDAYYGDEGLSEMLKEGFAVVATDYHGLGTPGPHRYMDKRAQAQDVINSVPAAHAAVRGLSRDWVVDGHSQGGLAAWAVAEDELRIKDPTYRGAVAVAGATHLGWLLDHTEGTKGSGFYLAWHAYAIHTRFPQFQIDRMLSPVAQAHYADVTSKGCWLYGFATYHGIEAPQMVKPDWRSIPEVRRFMTENSAGRWPIRGPIFVIAGEADGSVPLAGIRDTVHKACAIGTNVTFRSYPGLDHDPVMTNSTPDQLAWIRDRLHGRNASGNCGA